MSHVAPPAHLRLHDDPHEPVQSTLFSQSSVQLFGPQLLLVISHVCPDGQVHVEPMQLGGVWVPLLPHATNNTSDRIAKQTRTYLMIPSYARRVPSASMPITATRFRAVQVANTYTR